MLVRSLALVFVTHCLLRAVDGDEYQLKELHKKCNEENHLTMEESIDLNTTKQIETDDERIKCYIKCVLIGVDLMNENGDLTVEKLQDAPMKYKKHFPTCKDVTGPNPCEKALNFQNCMSMELSKEEGTSK